MLTHNGSAWEVGGNVEYVLDKVGNRKARNATSINPLVLPENALPHQAFNYDQLHMVGQQAQRVMSWPPGPTSGMGSFTIM